MPEQPKLLLYSLSINERQFTALDKLVGKEASAIRIAFIENAADVIPDSEEWVLSIRQSFKRRGYQVDPIDLRIWQRRPQQLMQRLTGKDVIWIGGGNTFYLRWILKNSGADEMIRRLVRSGIVFCGWSAGAIVAGPTIEYFEAMDNVEDAPELILDGLNLTQIIIIPHIDNADFIQGAHLANMQLQAAGYSTLPLGDTEALVIDGGNQRIID
ncbi:Type 1 glutamine amidotransferase-like domain-containing protein [Chitinophaga deserti]|uniref:Type 1 glutamine amidotransferase-like domain-containing protein n=1 Tax=Chitinophaga deserti TaxID=2164099 RepID=UPI000D6BF91D|nr:Type 1 glutamine amidotransferase-like domain-containing protein [Chitinophaga deserti]